MARSDYDFINLSLEHELNEWLAEKGYAGQAGTSSGTLSVKRMMPAILAW